MRTSSLDELRRLCRGIRKSFVHLETRDSYGTETELPHLARWRLWQSGGLLLPARPARRLSRLLFVGAWGPVVCEWNVL